VLRQNHQPKSPETRTADLSSLSESMRLDEQDRVIQHTERFHSQGKKRRQHGNEAVKQHILAARTVSKIVKTSLVRSKGGIKKDYKLRICDIGT